jgi:hypothetical protein
VRRVVLDFVIGERVDENVEPSPVEHQPWHDVRERVLCGPVMPVNCGLLGCPLNRATNWSCRSMALASVASL